MTTDAITWEKDDEGIVTLTIDLPEKSSNTISETYLDAMDEIVERLTDEADDITGVVVTSGKDTFFAGADLDLLIQATPEHTEDVAEQVARIKRQLRTLETLGVPVVAALNGTALGGGLELALACHHRIAVDRDGARFGFPEVQLGLLPGGGGVVRTVRMLGVMDALLKALTQGQQYRPGKAVEVGFVDELVESQDELIPAAKQWIRDNPDHTQQPWDRGGYEIPGGTPDSGELREWLPAIPANLRKEMKGAPYPAPRNIVAAAVEGTQVDFDTALEIEGRYFIDLAVGQVAKNMVQAFWFDLNAVNKGKSRPDGIDEWQATKVGVLGAGMMGAGIAFVCADAGMEVVLKDVSTENAEKGRQHSADILNRRVEKGRMSEEDRDAFLGRIHPTADAADLQGCDLLIEAVFENLELKHDVLAEAEAEVDDDALLASNTSSLPITELAQGVERPEDFIGLHFFSPVRKMPLVEIIRGDKTSDEALARAFDVVRQIGKTPIVVNDSRGFFTSRVIGTFLMEAAAMLDEGVNPASIEQAGLQAGYPAAPLKLFDELTLTLPLKLRDEAKKAAEREGTEYREHPGEAVLEQMVKEHGREGKAAGAGFYDYEDGKATSLWEGLFEHFPATREKPDIPFEDLKERMMFAEALETVKCFEEGVIESVPDANIGSVFGIGFSPWTGGVIQFIDQYSGGTAGFVARAKELADRYGDRFTPPQTLADAAERGERITDVLGSD